MAIELVKEIGRRTSHHPAHLFILFIIESYRKYTHTHTKKREKRRERKKQSINSLSVSTPVHSPAAGE